MNTVVELLVVILTAYLTFTNTLAGYVSTAITTVEERFYTEEVSEPTEPLSLIPSVFDKSIPDILLQSQSYQQAALGNAVGLREGTTKDALSALVNIFCTFKTKDYIKTTTGSGFFIDQEGVIMTNAHIAQFLLLEKTDSFGEATCTVRNGSPAAPRYTAELLYIPPTWIEENASVMNDSVPMGTGERDYALLYVSGDVSGWPLPALFPALSFDDELLPTSVKDSTVVAAGYPAKDLLAGGTSASLLAKVATTSISELYTFGSNYADVFSIKGSVVGAEGASGGPVVNEDGEVIGMIATRGNDEADGQGSLRAITLSHINRTIEEETGFPLKDHLVGDLPFRAQVFAETVTPFLITILQTAE